MLVDNLRHGETAPKTYGKYCTLQTSIAYRSRLCESAAQDDMAANDVILMEEQIVVFHILCFRQTTQRQIGAFK